MPSPLCACFLLSFFMSPDDPISTSFDPVNSTIVPGGSLFKIDPNRQSIPNSTQLYPSQSKSNWRLSYTRITHYVLYSYHIYPLVYYTQRFLPPPPSLSGVLQSID
ncbi:MAG: hypothetical protein J3Q66DRAFT_341053 [Benniella sp.]|nr:MAG: hypothetical protein J3Q66DRAFT_341053 [Benniella sp.]